MLTELKRRILSERVQTCMETAVEMTMDEHDEIRDAFLDNPDKVAKFGAENDPKIEKLIEKIPETEDEDPMTRKELEECCDNYIPGTKYDGR